MYPISEYADFLSCDGPALKDYPRLNYVIFRVCCPMMLSAYFVLLGALAKLREATLSFVMCLSVRPSSWNNSAPTGRVFTKFGI